METTEKIHGRRRAGGRHGIAVATIDEKARPKPRGRYAAYHFDDELVVPPMPERTPTVGVPVVPMPAAEPEPVVAPATEVVEKVVITEIPSEYEDVHVPTNTGPLTIVTGDPVPLDTGSQRQVSSRQHGRRRGAAIATAIATGGLLLAGGGHVLATVPKTKTTTATAAAHLAKPSDLENEDAESGEPDIITAPTDVVVKQQEIKVETKAAPLPEPEVVEVQEVVPDPVVTPDPVVVQEQELEQETVAPTTVAPAPTPAPAQVAASGKGAIIAAAARGQIGVGQDCTMLATNSLAAAGVNFHGWPWEYASLGTNVGVANAQPGDLLLYAAQNGMPAHIGVYIGNGRAIHGGWNGNQTVEWSSNVGWPAFPPYAAIRVN